MKPLYWILLALSVVACRATDRAAQREQARGPGSRVVIPDLAQPRVSEPGAPGERSAIPPLLSAEDSAAESGEAHSTGADALPQPELVAGASASTAESLDPDPGAAPMAPRDEQVPLDAEEAAIIEAVRARNFSEALRLVGALAAAPSLDLAKRLSAVGDFRGALDALQAALAEDPKRADLLEATGYARLALADAGERSFYASAREAFQAVNGSPTALLGQSRAAHRMGLWDEALDCAQRALLMLSVRPAAERLQLQPAAEVVLADAGLDLLKRTRAADPGTANTLQNELEAALRERIQSLSSDAAAHARLTTLYLDAGKVFEARAAAERGLGFSPGDEELAKLLARAALSVGGPSEVVSAFTRVRERFPQQPLVYWYPALERFKSALAAVQLDSRFSIPAQIDQAMQGFRECGRLDPRYSESCRQYEAMCICLRGWQLLAQDRLELARDWFLKMNAVSPGSIGMDPADVDAQFKGQLQDGLSGLARVAERHRDVHKDLPSAAAVFADLAGVAPQELAWALAAAKSAELAAEGLQGEADDLEAARTGAIQDPARLVVLRKLARVKDREVGSAKEAERFAATAVQRRESAQQFYASAWQSYLAAVALDPEDARLACDAARVAVYQTKREPARAEQLLQRSIQLAQAQSASSELNSSARAALEQTWGDALQYLGVLELETKLDYAAARQHLEQSLEHGARPYVREVLLPKAVAASKLGRATTAASTPSDTDDSKKPR